MPQTQTLAQLRTRAQRRADMEGPASGHVTTAEWTDLVNAGLRRVYQLLLEARGHEHYVSTQTITTAVGTASYALPDDHMLSLSFIASKGPDFHRELPAWQEDDLPRLLSSPRGDMHTAMARVQGGNVEVRPTPTEVFTITHRYTPTLTPLALDGDTFDGVNGWEEYAILHAANAALLKEESIEQAAALQAEMAAYERAIQSLAPHRHQTQPATVRLTRLDDVGELWPFGRGR